MSSHPDQKVTWTVLSLGTAADDYPVVTGMVDAHGYDHAEQLFEDEFPDQVILGIYEGDVPFKKAWDRYFKESV